LLVSLLLCVGEVLAFSQEQDGLGFSDLVGCEALQEGTLHFLAPGLALNNAATLGSCHSTGSFASQKGELDGMG